MTSISPLETQQLLDSDEVFACIDVRERGEFAGTQIAGTSPVNRGSLEYRVPVMIPNLEIPEAQADFGHTVWEGALGKSRADMERYLAWEIDLVKD